jgi:pimeloyl-ACP methyl ester carboxylesterase
MDISDIFKIAEKLNKEIKNSSRIEIKGAAHLVNMEKPEEFNRIIINYVKNFKEK